MLLPGPEAQQLATYVGWLLHGTRGGLTAGCLFVMPGVIAIMALSYLYVFFGKMGIVAAIFVGLKAAVLAIVLEAVSRIGRRALKSRFLIGIAAAAFIGIFFLGVPFPAIVIGAGLVGFLSAHFRATGPGTAIGNRREEAATGAASVLSDKLELTSRGAILGTFRAAAIALLAWLAPVIALVALLGSGNVFADIATFFSRMAVVTFGGAYAVLAYVAQRAVERYGWLTPGEMLDGLGMAETTPGPLIMVLQFVGFIAAFRDPGVLAPWVAGALGGLLATWVTFAPCFLWIFAGAPFVESIRGRKALAAGLSAITAAVVGVILNLAIWFAVHTLFVDVVRVRLGPIAFDAPVIASMNAWSVALSVAALLAIFWLRAGMATVLAGASAAGLLLFALGAI
jgi:chromate transporter